MPSFQRSWPREQTLPQPFALPADTLQDEVVSEVLTTAPAKDVIVHSVITVQWKMKRVG